MLANRRLYKKHFFCFQITLMILGTLVCSLWGGSYSIGFLLGATLMIVANCVFILRLFFNKANHHPLKELVILYLSEFAKLFVIVPGSVIIAIYLQPKLFPYILGLLVLQLAMWLMPLFMRLTHSRVTKTPIKKSAIYGPR